MFKVAKYEGLFADLGDDEYMVRFCGVEVSARGLASKSAYVVLKQLALKGTRETWR